jgi:hypothetical protein
MWAAYEYVPCGLCPALCPDPYLDQTRPLARETPALRALFAVSPPLSPPLVSERQITISINKHPLLMMPPPIKPGKASALQFITAMEMHGQRYNITRTQNSIT